MNILINAGDSYMKISLTPRLLGKLERYVAIVLHCVGCAVTQLRRIELGVCCMLM